MVATSEFGVGVPVEQIVIAVQSMGINSPRGFISESDYMNPCIILGIFLVSERCNFIGNFLWRLPWVLALWRLMFWRSPDVITPLMAGC